MRPELSGRGDRPRPARQLAVSLTITLGAALALPAVAVWLAGFSTLGLAFLFRI